MLNKYAYMIDFFIHFYFLLLSEAVPSLQVWALKLVMKEQTPSMLWSGESTGEWEMVEKREWGKEEVGKRRSGDVEVEMGKWGWRSGDGEYGWGSGDGEVSMKKWGRRSVMAKLEVGGT